MPVLGWLVGLGIPQRFVKPLLIAGAVVLVFVGCVTLKSCYDSRIIYQHDAAQTVKTLQKEAPANDKAANARASDTVTLTEQSKERTDAISKAPDSAPSDADIALNCLRLRKSGYDVSRLPSCAGRSGSSGK